MQESDEPLEGVLFDNAPYKDYSEVPIYRKLWLFHMLLLPLLLLIIIPGNPLSYLAIISLAAVILMWVKNIYFKRQDRVEGMSLGKKIIYTVFCGVIIYLGNPFDLPDYGTRIKIDRGELFYTENVDAATAQKLGDFFKEEKFFDRKISIQIHKEGDRLQIRMPVKAGSEKDPDLILDARRTLYMISENTLPDTPLEFHFCDTQLQTLRMVKPLDSELGTRLSFDWGRMYYSVVVTREQAEAMANKLANGNFFNGDGYMLQYDKVGEEDVLRFMLVQFSNEVDEAQAKLQLAIMRGAAEIAFGDDAPRVEILVLGPNLNVLKTVRN